MDLCTLQGLKGTVVNYACQLLNKVSLKITCILYTVQCTVPVNLSIPVMEGLVHTK